MQEAQKRRLGRGHSFCWPSRPRFLTAAPLSGLDIMSSTQLRAMMVSVARRGGNGSPVRTIPQKAPGGQAGKAGKATRQRILCPNRKVIYHPVLFARELPSPIAGGSPAEMGISKEILGVTEPALYCVLHKVGACASCAVW